MSFFSSHIRRYKSLFQGVGLLMICTTIEKNAETYGIDLVHVNFPRPEHFLEVNVLAINLILLSFIAVDTHLTIAKYIVGYHFPINQKNIKPIKKYFINTGKSFSIYVLPVFMLLTPVFSSYIQFESVLPLLILFLGIPIFIHFSISKGFYQGTNQFKKTVLCLMIEMSTGLFVTSILVCWLRSQSDTTEILMLTLIITMISHEFLSLKNSTSNKNLTPLRSFQPTVI